MEDCLVKTDICAPMKVPLGRDACREAAPAWMDQWMAGTGSTLQRGDSTRVFHSYCRDRQLSDAALHR